MAIPKYDDLFNPLLKAMHRLGGSASVQEIEEKVANILKLTDKQINEVHRGNRTKLSYRLAWTRNYLKRYGLLENSSRGVWALTNVGNHITKVDKKKVNKKVKSLDFADSKSITKRLTYTVTGPETWRDQLLNYLKEMDPRSFERLCQRVLRESGFVEVEVTERSKDGGIDGVGKVRLGGFLSFKVVFQCKRYRRSITAKQIRDFRGAMVGRSDKGLFITTSTFTRGAKEEAEREGAFPIDLINGNLLTEKMKEFKLGVIVEQEEIIKFDKNWFESAAKKS